MKNVELLFSPDNTLKIIYTACRTCYSAETISEIWDKAYPKGTFTPEQYITGHNEKTKKMLSLVDKVLKSNHLSVTRHINYTFAINGFSRACLEQLKRHFAGWNYTQQSLRYVTIAKELTSDYLLELQWDEEENWNKLEEISNKYYVNPYNKDNNTKNYKTFILGSIESLCSYLEQIEQGAEAEDARGLLGLNFRTNLMATCNLQALMHFANLRLCTNSQSEIRQLAKTMCDLVIKKDEWVKEYLVPKCEMNGYCDEINCCGRKVKKNKVIKGE